MPMVCPQCGALQPTSDRCANCGYKFETPVETSQGTRVTRRQLWDYALAIVLLVVAILVACVLLVVAIVLLAN